MLEISNPEARAVLDLYNHFDEFGSPAIVRYVEIPTIDEARLTLVRQHLDEIGAKMIASNVLTGDEDRMYRFLNVAVDDKMRSILQEKRGRILGPCILLGEFYDRAIGIWDSAD